MLVEEVLEVPAFNFNEVTLVACIHTIGAISCEDPAAESLAELKISRNITG